MKPMDKWTMASQPYRFKDLSYLGKKYTFNIADTKSVYPARGCLRHILLAAIKHQLFKGWPKYGFITQAL